MDNKQIKSIMDSYIQDGSKTALECFQAVCNAVGLIKEFNAIVCLEKIMKNNVEIADYNAKHMYDKSAALCTQNANLYARIQQELGASDKEENVTSEQD